MPYAGDSIWFTANAAGSGSFVVASAVAGYRTPNAAAVPNGSILHYSARTATEFENGEGTYNSGTSTLTRTTIFASSNANALVTFGSIPSVAITPLAEDAIFPTGAVTDNTIMRWDGTVAANSPKAAQGSIPTIDDSGVITLPNTGLHVFDTDASHDLIFKPGSNLTADRTWTITTGDADRVLTMSGDTTLGGGAHSGTNTGDEPTASTGIEGVVTLATAAEWYQDAAVVKALSVTEAWDAMAEATITYNSGTTTWNMDTGIDFVLTFGAGNIATMQFPTNITIGKKGRMRVVQDGTGSRIVTAWEANYTFASGTAPVLSTGANDVDILYYDCISSSNVLIVKVAGDIA